jgi:hypothetical protein
MKFALYFLALSALAALALCAPALPSGLVRTPSGVFPSRCVHSIPSGSTMDRNPSTGRLHVHLADGTLHAILPKCDGARASLPADYDGWEACASPFFAPEFCCCPCSICSLAKAFLHRDISFFSYTAYNDPQNKTFDSFLGFFTVPDKPKQTPDASASLFLHSQLTAQRFSFNTAPPCPSPKPLLSPYPGPVYLHRPSKFRLDPPSRPRAAERRLRHHPASSSGHPVFPALRCPFPPPHARAQYPCDEELEWCIKSWYVTLDDGAVYSDAVIVQAGECPSAPSLASARIPI